MLNKLMNDSRKRTIPQDVPLDFINNRWNKYVFEKDGTISRRYYELAVLTELKNNIRSGDVSVVGSGRHKDFDEYLVSIEDWNNIKTGNTGLAVSNSFSEYIEERKESLLQRIRWISENIQSLYKLN